MIKNGGWQTNVQYFEDYVLKTPKTREEIKDKIYSYLEKKGNLGELNQTIDRMVKDWNSSVKIIQGTKMPYENFANPEFLEGGKIKQKRVEILSEIFEELSKSFEKNKKEIEKILDKEIKFIFGLWGYGLHEKTFKFDSEYGILNEKIVLVDFGELTNKFETAKKQIELNKPDLEGKKKYIDSRIVDMFIEKRKKFITLENLEKYWGKNLK